MKPTSHPTSSPSERLQSVAAAFQLGAIEKHHSGGCVGCVLFFCGSFFGSIFCVLLLENLQRLISEWQAHTYSGFLVEFLVLTLLLALSLALFRTAFLYGTSTYYECSEGFFQMRFLQSQPRTVVRWQEIQRVWKTRNRASGTSYLIQDTQGNIHSLPLVALWNRCQREWQRRSTP